MENLKEKLLHELAVERVNKLKRFYRSLILFVLVLIFINGIRFLKYGLDSVFVLKYVTAFAVWALILIIKAINLFLIDGRWERKLIEKELKKQDYGNL